MNRFFVCGWGGEAKLEIGDGGWGEGFWLEMEGDAKVEIEDGGWGEGFLSEMEGEGDGFRSERWRVGVSIRVSVSGSCHVEVGIFD